MRGGERLPARPPRDVRLDVVRGVLQLSIFAKHVGYSFAGGWLIHSNWGFSDSSELFVFLSGLTLGSVFALKQARDGWGAATRDMLGRAWRLYRIHLLVFALFAALMLVACAAGLPDADLLGWRSVLDDPVGALPGVLLMLNQPSFMGILPTFVWGMLLLPGFALLATRFGDAAMLVSVGLYLAVQATRVSLPSLRPGAGLEFNPLAWQVLFLGGAWLGRRALLRGRGIALPPGWARAVDWACGLFLAGALAMRVALLGPDYAPWPAPPFGEPGWLHAKADLPLPALLHALALAWLVARMVPREAVWMRTWLAARVATIGRFSLEVFCLGLFLAWGADHLLALSGGALAVDFGVTLGGAVVLGAWAAWLGGRGRRQGAVVREHGAPARP